MIDAGCLCYDIGAHYGETAQRFLDLSAGRVVSVEACHQNYLVLAARFQDDARVATLHAAASDATGLVEIHRSARQSGLSTLAPMEWRELYPDISFDPGELVMATTLDVLHDRFGRPHLVKVDVEGHELQVLQGMSFRPTFIVFEFHGRFIDRAIACLELLASRGYERAEIYRSEADFQAPPTMPLAHVIDLLRAAPPDWGNISVG